MSFIDKIINSFSPNTPEYLLYKDTKKTLKEDIKLYDAFETQATHELKDIFSRGYSQESKEYTDAMEKVQGWKYEKNKRKLQLKFIRPNKQEDIAYRDNQGDSFAKKLQQVLSHNLDLRFHGTPIYFAEHIIKNGEISSSAERLDGYIRSTDVKGTISVTDRNSIDRTIQFFTDIAAYNHSLPCGCVFAVLPKDVEDAKYGIDVMHSVYFRKNPRQLYGIFTTPENIEKVKKWMKDSDLNPDIVYTFEEFLKVVERDSKRIDAKTDGVVPKVDISSNSTKGYTRIDSKTNDKQSYIESGR